MSDRPDRLTALEVEVQHLTKEVAAMKATVTELRDLLIAAKGARWLLGILIAIGSFSAGMLAKYLPFPLTPR